MAVLFESIKAGYTSFKDTFNKMESERAATKAEKALADAETYICNAFSKKEEKEEEVVESSIPTVEGEVILPPTFTVIPDDEAAPAKKSSKKK